MPLVIAVYSLLGIVIPVQVVVVVLARMMRYVHYNSHDDNSWCEVCYWETYMNCENCGEDEPIDGSREFTELMAIPKTGARVVAIITQSYAQTESYGRMRMYTLQSVASISLRMNMRAIGLLALLAVRYIISTQSVA